MQINSFFKRVIKTSKKTVKMENNSHQDIAKNVPAEIEGWNWGAFFLNGIWGIGNKTYIALLAFIPIINVFMMVILGLKGNKMAWKNKEWDSVEHFLRVQRYWNIAGLVALGVYIILFFVEIWKVVQ